MERRRTSDRSVRAGDDPAVGDGLAPDGGARPGLGSLTIHQSVRLIRRLWSERGCRTRAVRRRGSIYVLCVCPTDGRREVVEVAAASDVGRAALERLAAVRDRLDYDAAVYVSLRFGGGGGGRDVEILGRSEVREVIGELGLRTAVESAFGIEIDRTATPGENTDRADGVGTARATARETAGGAEREGTTSQLSYSIGERADALVSQARGDSVTERRLLGSETTGPLADAPLIERLRRSEHPQFVLESRRRGVASDRHGTLAPSSDFRALTAVTDERLLAVVGTESRDRTISVPWGAITAVETDAGVFSSRLSVVTDDDAYDFWASAGAIDDAELAAAESFVASRRSERSVRAAPTPDVSAFESHAVETTRREFVGRAAGYGAGALALYWGWTRLSGDGSPADDADPGAADSPPPEPRITDRRLTHESDGDAEMLLDVENRGGAGNVRASVALRWTAGEEAGERIQTDADAFYLSAGESRTVAVATDYYGFDRSRYRYLTDVVATDAPVASFDIVPSEPKAGERLTLDGSASHPGGGPIASYDWSSRFGGLSLDRTGERVTVRVPEAAGRAAQVTLSVTDEAARTDSTTAWVPFAHGSE
jgi:hypothetical protein